MLGKDLLNKIKAVTDAILFQSEVKEPEAIVFASEKLKDSEQEVKYSELAVGSDVFISGANGDEPATDGEYVLDSGISFKVLDGKISEVVEAPVEEEVAPEELAVEEPEVADEVAPEAKPADDESKQKIAELEAKIAELEAQLKKQNDFSVDEFSTLKNDVKSMAEILKALANTPAEFSQTDSRAEANDFKTEKLNYLASIISNKNK
jgi:hypothetical protein